MNTDNVRAGDVIKVATTVRAVVSTVYADRPGEIEVVYLDDRDRAINEDAIWEDGMSQFLVEGVCGGYADRYDRLDPFVAKLRHGL